MKSLLKQESPSLVVMTGDMASGWVGKGKAGWFETQNKRWSKWLQKENNQTDDFQYLYTLGNHDRQADLSPKEIVELDKKNPNSLTDSFQGDSSNY